jgi:hypothetical protein
VKIQPNRDKLVSLPHGQIEEHTSQYRKRMYHDGTVKGLHVECGWEGGDKIQGGPVFVYCIVRTQSVCNVL